MGVPTGIVINTFTPHRSADAGKAYNRQSTASLYWPSFGRAPLALLLLSNIEFKDSYPQLEESAAQKMLRSPRGRNTNDYAST
jgi:hypothetical protein